MQAFVSSGSLTVRLKAPPKWLNRNLDFTPFVARVLPIVGNFQGNCLGLSFGFFGERLWISGSSLVAEMVKNLPTVQETWVQSLGWDDPLEK